jgi:imidazolonepropionase-like amidohydrolase
MSAMRFTNVRNFDGSGIAPYAGEVVVLGDRIRDVLSGGAGSAESVASAQAHSTMIDGAGAILMPGLVEPTSTSPGLVPWNASSIP